MNDQVAAPDEIEGVLADFDRHRRPDGFLPLLEEVEGGSLGFAPVLSVRGLDMDSRMVLVMLSDEWVSSE